jgi:transcriptional regulator
MEQWKHLNGKYVTGLLDEILAFRIEVTEMQAASKISQNKSAEEREKIAAHLSENGDAPARALADYMRKRGHEKDL